VIWAAQVVPPFVVATTVLGPFGPCPAAQQSLVEMQVIAE
jgi:hypothetical protein